jgi:Fe-S-cluster containining protein
MATSASTIFPPPAPLKLGGDIAADWERFESEWANYEIATDLAEVPEKKRAAIFLACIGTGAYAVFRTFKFENETDKSKVEMIMEAFKKHCVGEVNVTYERYLFHQRVQQPGECFENFCSDLRKLASTCQFETLEDSLIRDRIVIGIRDDPTRRRLLQIKKLSLAETVESCKASEATSRRLHVMSGAGEEVDALGREASSRSRYSSSKSREWTTRPDQRSGRRCRFCDGLHGDSKQDCPSYGQQCRRCLRYNHWEKVCRSAPAATTGRRNEAVQELDYDCDELLTLHGPDNKHACCQLNVEGTPLLFLLDCGATVNLLPLEDAVAIDPKLTTLRPATKRLTMFDDKELKTLGVITANVMHPQTGIWRRTEFHVAATHHQAILGSDACREMQLIVINYANLCDAADDDCVVSPETLSSNLSYSSTVTTENERDSNATTARSTENDVVEKHMDDKRDCELATDVNICNFELINSNEEMDANIVDKSECVDLIRAEKRDFDLNRLGLNASDQIAFVDSDTEHSRDMFIESAVIDVTRRTDNPLVRNETTLNQQALHDANELSCLEIGNINATRCDKTDTPDSRCEDDTDRRESSHRFGFGKPPETRGIRAMRGTTRIVKLPNAQRDNCVLKLSTPPGGHGNSDYRPTIGEFTAISANDGPRPPARRMSVRGAWIDVRHTNHRLRY